MTREARTSPRWPAHARPRRCASTPRTRTRSKSAPALFCISTARFAPVSGRRGREGSTTLTRSPALPLRARSAALAGKSGGDRKRSNLSKGEQPAALEEVALSASADVLHSVTAFAQSPLRPGVLDDITDVASVAVLRKQVRARAQSFDTTSASRARSRPPERVLDGSLARSSRVPRRDARGVQDIASRGETRADRAARRASSRCPDPAIAKKKTRDPRAPLPTTDTPSPETTARRHPTDASA